MFKQTWKKLMFTVGLSLSLVVAGCGSDDGSTDGSAGAGGDVELVYVEWDSEIASTHVIAQVLEDQGFNVTVTPLDNAIMWQSVANGEADGMVAGWLPATHGDLYAEYEDQLVNLGENLAGARIGLVVPDYMDATSISDLAAYGDEIGNTITGIEAGAGVVQAAEQAVEDYGLAGWEVQTSSSGAMATALGEAINNEAPIAVTGWTPHWKFAQYDLKYLEDPEGSFGGEEYIATMVREGFEEDNPTAYQILDQFNWTAADMESVMLDIQEGVSPVDAAAAWVEANQDKVDEWIAGIE